MNIPIEFPNDLLNVDFALIQDSVMSERLKKYIAEYYGKHITNCSTLARFLLDGNFIECSESNGSFTIDGNFTRYTDQEIETGDIILLMFNKVMVKSSNSDLTEHFMRLTKSAIFPEDENKTLSSDQIQKIYKRNYHSYSFNDFHLATCIGRRDPEVVFIFQSGWFYPEDRWKDRIGTKGKIMTCFEKPASFLKLSVVPLLLKKIN